MSSAVNFYLLLLLVVLLFFKKSSEYICDLGYNKNLEKKGKKVIVEQNNERTYRTYGNKNSRLFVRIYDKTQDLKDDKFIHAYLYPERYKNECRRVEAKLTLEYARADAPINRLKMVKRDKQIQIKEQNEKIMYKTILLYTIGIAEINVPNIEECIRVLDQARQRINNKLKILNGKIPNERLPTDNNYYKSRSSGKIRLHSKS